MSLLQFPALRQQYSSIDNPLYVSDIVQANQAMLDAITAIAGLGASDFAIFGDLQYIEAISGPNYYTPGIFYLNGVWYYQPEAFDENEYLEPNITGELPYTFEDATIRDLYDINFGQAVGSSSPSTSPEFSGNMNAYRLDLKTISNQVNTLILQTTLQVIKPGAFTGTVTINFRNDQSIFYNGSSGDVFIAFDMTNAVPGTVVTMMFTFGAGQSVTISGAAGTVWYLESGTLSSAASNVNTMYFVYVGVDITDLQQIRYNISQV